MQISACHCNLDCLLIKIKHPEYFTFFNTLLLAQKSTQFLAVPFDYLNQ